MKFTKPKWIDNKVECTRLSTLCKEKLVNLKKQKYNMIRHFNSEKYDKVTQDVALKGITTRIKIYKNYLVLTEHVFCVDTPVNITDDQLNAISRDNFDQRMISFRNLLLSNGIYNDSNFRIACKTETRGVNKTVKQTFFVETKKVERCTLRSWFMSVFPGSSLTLEDKEEGVQIEVYPPADYEGWDPSCDFEYITTIL